MGKYLPGEKINFKSGGILVKGVVRKGEEDVGKGLSAMNKLKKVPTKKNLNSK